MYIELYVAAILVCLTILVYMLIRRRYGKLQNTLYISITSIVMINAISLVISTIFNEHAAEYPFHYAMFEIAEFSYFLLHTILAPMFFYYVICVSGIFEKTGKVKHAIFLAPAVITELFVITNPFTHFVYYINSDYEFTRNWAEWLIYAAAAFYFVLSFITLMLLRRAMTNRRRLALLYFFVLAIVGIFIQMLFIKIKAELFAESLALIGLLLAIENEDDRIDADTGIYNRKALNMDLKNFYAIGREFYIIRLTIQNADIIGRITGSVNIDRLTEIVDEYLKTIVDRFQIYEMNPGDYAITYFGDRESVTELVWKIDARFMEPWRINDNEFFLKAVQMVAKLPNDFTTIKEISFMLNSAVPSNVNKTVLMGNDLDFLRRRDKVEQAIERGLHEGNFSVFYQPVYFIDGKRLHGAEALVRLNDPELGFIPPDEFIPIAEQIGRIEEIGDFVLKEVCRFLQSGVPAEHGLYSINVNLSVIQCIRPGFVDHILNVISEYKVPKHQLNFEITESVAAEDYEVLGSSISDLKGCGFQFYMDDYGTGYSNIQSVFALDFDIIKIDKSILWGADAGELGKIILENSVHMIQRIGKKVLVEGVETKEQIESLRSLEVDYLQGFYFSKPLPKDEFIEHLKKVGKEES